MLVNRILSIATASALVLGSMATLASAQQVEVEVFELENGMKFLLVPRTDQPNTIAAGWLAKVGSVNEGPGTTGLSHFFEHMMFKGTSTIGTRDAEADADFRRRQREVRDRMNDLIWGDQYQRFFRGEIDDPWDERNDSEELRALRNELRSLMDGHRDIIVKDEFDQVYTRLGGSSMNAFTSHDLTFYFIAVPSNKFELWAWMESDRLSDSVFREFYAEREVVHEERRLVLETTPTGLLDEQFDAMFWVSSGYGWSILGWPSNISSYTPEQAERFWETYYRPNNLVGVVVGDFDPGEARHQIERYFSRLSPGTSPPPPVVTLEVGQRAEQRLYGECDCEPQVEVRYHSVPFGHADSYALDVLSQILNGRTGRLYRGLVEGREIAANAFARQDSRKYAGAFSFTAQAKGDSSPQELEAAWYEELARLQEELVPEMELQKVKNQLAADSFRRLQSNFFLMIQLGYYEGLGGWEHINEQPRRMQAVTAEDVRRVANAYFDRANRSVAIYTRRADAAPIDPELAALPPEVRGFVQQSIRQLEQIDDLETIRMALAQMSAQSEQVPPEFKAAFDHLVSVAQRRLAELEAEGGDQ